MQIKIADFGLSDLQTVSGGNLSSTFCGSPLYAAPELMTSGAAPDGYDAAKSDVRNTEKRRRPAALHLCLVRRRA